MSLAFPLQIRDNENGPGGAGNTDRSLTHSSELAERGLAMKATPCVIPGCESPAHARGWCNRHYLRWWVHGDPLTVVQIKGDDDARLWSKVTQPSPEACWEWTEAAVDKDGYGTTWFRGKQQRAPRVAWMLTNGPIPEGEVVRHKCDNPPCVNPAHLELGTERDNTNDRLERGRSASGENNGGGGRLIDAQVVAIRQQAALGQSHRVIAARYSVSRSTISNIVSRKIWRCVP